MNINDYIDVNGDVLLSKQLISDLISIVDSRSRHYYLEYSGDRPGLTNNLIELFNSAEIGSHSYTGVWQGNYYFGGNIYKINTGLGMITFIPVNGESTHNKIYNAGAGWQEI